MVSRRRKLASYVTETDSSSSEDGDYVPAHKTQGLHTNKNDSHNISKVKQEFADEIPNQRLKRMKCTTKNALMARENRQRKKTYIQNLEHEVSKLRADKTKMRSILDNQSFVISELRKEVKYMKSVLANSSDIGNLIKNIRCSTGMSVTSSLDKSLTVNNDCVSKHKTYMTRKTAHPWDNDCNAIPDDSVCAAPAKNVCEDFDVSNILTLPLDIDIPFPEFQFDFDKIEDDFSPFEPTEQANSQNTEYSSTLHNTLREHNYTNVFSNNYSDNEDDVGVCLHVSKHRVSLEFCPSCSENAVQTWKEMK